MILEPFTTVCCATTAQTFVLVIGASMIAAGLFYARIVIRRLSDVNGGSIHGK
ncbi:MAG TPA: hypothetical protein VD833_12740 [Vicinamibacterales bacterium]|nr:hypothetical protein [Vicinamibacterales bacterium]